MQNKIVTVILSIGPISVVITVTRGILIRPTLPQSLDTEMEFFFFLANLWFKNYLPASPFYLRLMEKLEGWVDKLVVVPQCFCQ